MYNSVSEYLANLLTTGTKLAKDLAMAYPAYRDVVPSCDTMI